MFGGLVCLRRARNYIPAARARVRGFCKSSANTNTLVGPSTNMASLLRASRSYGVFARRPEAALTHC
jgi:hypothetical protein